MHAQNNIMRLTPCVNILQDSISSLKSSLKMHLFDKPGAVTVCCLNFQIQGKKCPLESQIE